MSPAGREGTSTRSQFWVTDPTLAQGSAASPGLSAVVHVPCRPEHSNACVPCYSVALLLTGKSPHALACAEDPVSMAPSPVLSHPAPGALGRHRSSLLLGVSCEHCPRGRKAPNSPCVLTYVPPNTSMQLHLLYDPSPELLPLFPE